MKDLDLVNFVLSILSVLSFVRGWISLSAQRFSFYKEYEAVEEKVRIYCTSLNNFEGFLNLPIDDSWTEDARSEFMKFFAKQAFDDYLSSRVYGQDISDMNRLFTLISHHGLILDNRHARFGKWEEGRAVQVVEIAKFHDTLKRGHKFADRLLGAIREEKKRLNGCILGNLRAICLLFQSAPISKSSIMNIAFNLATNPNEKLGWYGRKKPKWLIEHEKKKFQE